MVSSAVGRGRPFKYAHFVALEGVWGKGVCLDVSVRGCLCHVSWWCLLGLARNSLAHAKLTSLGQVMSAVRPHAPT